MLGRIEGRRRRERQSMRWLDAIIGSMDMSLSKFREIVKDREAWHAAVHEIAKRWTKLSNYTTTKFRKITTKEKKMEKEEEEKEAGGENEWEE